MTRFTDSPYERMMTRRPEGGKETSRPPITISFGWKPSIRLGFFHLFA